MSHAESVMLYCYDSSPFSQKIENVLTLKRIPHQKVNVSSTLPRPDITDYLGITYRQIPILAIGNDVYCDTSLIACALERRFPAQVGYGTLFPTAKHSFNRTDSGVIKAFSKFYSDNSLFPRVVNLLPWDKVSEYFIQDRSALVGARIDVKARVASAPSSQSIISSHLLLFEEQLNDSREWLFDTISPSLADISVHFILDWARPFKAASTLFDSKRIPYTIKWFNRLSEAIEIQRKLNEPTIPIHGLDAAQKIISSGHETYDVVGFDVSEASRLGVVQGQVVEVVPEETGRNYPTRGKLVALNHEEITLEVHGSMGLLRCHFPRFGFFIRPVSQVKL